MKNLLGFRFCFYFFLLGSLLIPSKATYALSSSDPDSLLFFDGFEQGLGAWTMVDANYDGYCWSDSTHTGSYAHSGTHCAASLSYDEISYISIRPDNWLISPAITIPASGSAQLTWYMRVYSDYYCNEYISVYVSNSNDITDMDSPIYSGIFTNTSYTQIECDISAFMGQTIYIAFRHHNCYDQYALLLDDVSVVHSSNPPCPAPLALSAQPDTTFATISWVGMADAYLVTLTNTDNEVVYSTTTSSNTIVLNNLQPLTSYHVQVAPSCNTSRTESIDFQTTIPFLPIVYVKPDANGMGRSWNDAIGDINLATQRAAAIEEIYEQNCDVWVAAGTYTTDSYFEVPSKINVFGGFAGNEAPDFNLTLRDLNTHRTILDGGSATSGDYLLNQAYVADSLTCWDGFTITHAQWGGVRMRGNFRLNNCRIVNNVGYSYGGIYAYGNYSSPNYIDHCIISGNSNTTTYTSYSYPSAVYLAYSNLRNCLISNNSTSSGSAAVFAHYNSTIDHCDIISNTSYYTGCEAPGIYNTSATLTNSIVWGNRVVNSTGESTTQQVYIYNGTVSHCAVEGGVSGSNCIILSRQNSGSDPNESYPHFAQIEDTNYTLTEGSACIDAGTPTATASETDLLGNPRRFGEATDIGCYEYQNQTFCPRPTNITVTYIGTTSALVSWQVPEENDSNHITVEYKTEDSDTWTTLPNLTGENHILDDLSENTTYQLRTKLNCSNSESSTYSQPIRFTTIGHGDSEVLVGDTTADNKYYLPTNNYYNYSYTQQLFTPTNLDNTNGEIKSVSFLYNYDVPLTRNIILYLGHTSQSSYTSYSDYVPAENLQRCFADEVTFTPGWVTLTLQQPFSYNGSDNLVLAVVDSTGSYVSPYDRFRCTNTEEPMSLYFYSDYNVPTPSSPTVASSKGSLRYRNTVKINYQETSCPAPNIIVRQTHPSSAEIVVVGSNNLQIEYAPTGSNEYIAVGSAAGSYTLTNLTPFTHYTIRARTLCSEGPGFWRYFLFQTSIPDYDHLFVAPQSSGLADGSSWSNATSDINWAITLAASVPEERPDIWIKEGTYTGSNNATAFTLLNGVEIYGGFVGDEPATYDLSQRNPAAHPTILDGQHQRQVASLASGHCLLDGLTFSRGGATSSSIGSLLDVRDATATIRNCAFLDDSSGTYSIFIRGISQADKTTLDHCIIRNNNTTNYYTLYLSYADVSNTLIANNSSPNYTIYTYGYATLEHCDIVRNHVRNNYSIVYLSSTNLMNNTIVWGNLTNNSYTVKGSTYEYLISNSAIQGDIEGKSYNIVPLQRDNLGIFAPHFVSPTLCAGPSSVLGDWQLSAGSYCANRGGSLLLSASPSDLAGNERLQNDSLDLGCYESPFFAMPLPSYPDSIVYVSQGGIHDGTSWENALGDLSLALSLANHYNLKIWVAQGTYSGDTSLASAFTVKPGQQLYGGFLGNETPDYDLTLRDLLNHPSILDGNNLQRVVLISGKYGLSTLLDGFTIQNGEASSDYGGGINAQNYVTLRNISLRDNHANYGGGAYLYNHSSFKNGTVAYNSTSNYGGGIYANYYSVVENTSLHHNSSYYYGGGFYSSSGDTLRNALLYRNSSRYYGSGAYVSSGSVINSTIVNNTLDNTSSYYDGALYASYTTVANSIVWGNKHGLLPSNFEAYSDVTVSHCAFEEGDTVGNSLVLASSNDGYSNSQYFVRFMDPLNDDYHLHVSSPCVDLGDNSFLLPSVDLDGLPRLFGDAVDLGPYEVQEISTCPTVQGLTVGNITSSSAVVTWHPSGNATSFAVTYGIQGETDTTITVTDTTVQLTSLRTNRNYTVRVSALCGSDHSVLSIPATFQTICDSSSLSPLSELSNFSPANNDIVYAQRCDFSWSSLPMATSYDFYLWEEGAPQPATPTLSDLSIAGVSDYALPNFNPGKHYNWKVVAWNECLQRECATQTFRINELPNLHVSALSNSTPVANQTVTVQWTVSNDGAGNTPPGETWNDYIWIAGINEIGGGFLYDVDEVLLATVPNLTALNAGESYTNSTQVTIPAGYIGNYYLFVMTDQHNAVAIDYTPTGDSIPPIPYAPSISGSPYPYLISANSGWPGNYVWSQIAESVETDNFFYKLTTILPPPAPDLQVTHISHPTNAFSNTDITVQWTVTNAGEAATVGSQWTDALYIASEEPFSTTSATHLATVRYDSVPLPIGGSYTHAATVHIPLQYMGPYHIYVVTDANNNVYEGLLDGNNTGVSSQALNVTLSPTANLEVAAIATPTDSLSDNSTYELTYTVRNHGAATTEEGSWIDALYLQPDSLFNPSTAEKLRSWYHYGALEADSSYTQTVSFSLPANHNGLYFIFVETDMRNDIFEYDGEGDNVGRKVAPIVVCKPDLVGAIVAMNDTLDANQEQEIVWRITNQGAGIMTQRNVKSEFLLNGIPFYTITSNISLLPGESYQHSSRLTLPCASQQANSLSFRVDSDNKIDEGQYEGNNTTDNHPLQIASPDLYATHISLGEDLWSGKPTTVSWTMHNGGNGQMDNPVGIRFYFNQSPNNYQRSDSIATATIATQLAPSDSLRQSTTLRLPNGVFGNCYLHLVVNPDNDLCEGANQHNNHAISAQCNVQLSPYPDLVADQVAVSDTLTVGITAPLSYRLRNQGTAPLDAEVTLRYYLSHSTTLSPNNATLLHSERKRLSIGIGASQEIHTAVVLPATENAGRAYLHVEVDADNNIYEYTGEANNTACSNPTQVKIYPIDLTASQLMGPTTVEWGETVSYDLTVTNTSEVATLAPSWDDALYLSSDEVLQRSDTRLAQSRSERTLNPGESYTSHFSFSVPFGTPATTNLIGVADVALQHADINPMNNNIVKVITVRSVPTPDLELTQIAWPEVLSSGQEALLLYTVTNNSTEAIVEGSWNDKVFLQTTANSAALEIGSKSHTRMNLAAGASYSDTLRMTIPLPMNGNLNLRFSANAGNILFETNRSNNDSLGTLAVALPLPGDLTVRNIHHSDTATSGIAMEASWEVANEGENGLSGNGLRSLVYLSMDTLFDARDKLIGDATTQQVTLAPGERLTQRTMLRISGVAEGNYYIIVKTDVANAFNETNDSNNSGCSPTPLHLKVKALPFNTTLSDTLWNNQANDYKITIGDETHETVSIKLWSSDSARGAVNNIYVTHNAIGDNLNYTYSTNGQNSGNPQLFIPSTESGYYGVNIYGSTPAAEEQQTAIRAEVLPFELIGCAPTYGGNSGKTTIEITGSRFRPDMKVRLEKDGTYIACDTLIYDSYYRVFARFDLTGKDTGLYSLTALNYCEGEARMEEAFSVENGRGDNLLTNIVFPNAPRPNRNIVLMLEFENQGNSDIENAVVRITSHGGSHIALTPEGLEAGQTVLEVPLSVAGEVPGLLRAGVYGTINIHCFTSGTLLFQLERVR